MYFVLAYHLVTYIYILITINLKASHFKWFLIILTCSMIILINSNYTLMEAVGLMLSYSIRILFYLVLYSQDNDRIETRRKSIFYTIMFILIFYLGSFFVLRNVNLNLNDELSEYKLLYFIPEIIFFKPVLEEFSYRYIPYILLKKIKTNHAIFILIYILMSSFLFSLSHYYTTNNYIIKMSHMFFLGIMLAFINLKYGIKHSIFGHILYNILCIAVPF